MKKSVLAFALTIFSLNVFALTGNDFLNSIERKNGSFVDSYKGFSAIGFLEGVTERVITSYRVQYRKDCPVGGVSNGQRLDIVKKYLENHPDTLDLPAEVLISKAMHNSFQCFTYLEKFEKP